MRVLPLGLLLAMLLGSPLGAADELKEILEALRNASNVEDRLDLVERLVALNTSRAAAALARLVRTDEEESVRVAAAEGIGKTRTDNARELLLELVTEGGTREVRRAVATALTHKDGARAALLEILDSPRTDPLGRGLILRALAAFRDDTTRDALLAHAAGQDSYLRGEALHGLRDRPGLTDALRERLRAILASSRDEEALLQALDLAEDLEDLSFLPLLDRLRSFPEPAVGRAAEHLAARLRWLDAVKRSREAVLEGYGTPEVPPEPPPRARFDIVFVIDVTGSTVVVLEELRARIRQEMTIIERLGNSLRIGVVGYRMWKDLARNVPREEVLPLTYDAARVEAFLDDLRSRGPDSQGADITRGLTQALDRMGWRWNAPRFVHLVADSNCHDPARAKLVTLCHFRADETRTRVIYVLRTRRKVPEELEELARLGGTGVVELMR